MPGAPAAGFMLVHPTVPSTDAVEELVLEVRRLAATGALDLPLPGNGATWARFQALAEIAARDLSLSRIVEGHVDAIAILAEAGQVPAPGIYGVWAAESPDHRVEATRGPGGWRLRGRKRYASGARGIDRALVTARCSDGDRLFDIALGDRGVRPIAGSWQAVGMAATDSIDVELDHVVVADERIVGTPGFYLTRAGFWRGAVGVAACWYGGALGCFRFARSWLRRGTPSEHQLAHLGGMAATCEVLRVVLVDAADLIDQGHDARVPALVVRHVVEQGCQDVMTRCGRALGSSPLVFDAS
ncbi:MAG TPA: acyl-CoA dehydrogenase family protein, partial [Kofleriaceae bacterium]|nr:acyl-CoA dehydrogenase family protein [Kofleriaceae bacterium]